MVLGAVLVLVAAVAWACSGGGGRDRVADAQGSLTPSPSGSPSLPVAGPMPTVTVTVTSRPSPTGTAPADRKGGPCSPKEMVLNLTSSRSAYGKGKKPVFTLTAVNVGDKTCTFDVSPAALELRISSGNDRIWSSADCAAAKRDLRRFPTGVPHVREISWNRKRSGKRCDTRRATAKAGTYVAKVAAPDLKADSAVFHLR